MIPADPAPTSTLWSASPDPSLHHAPGSWKSLGGNQLEERRWVGVFDRTICESVCAWQRPLRSQCPEPPGDAGGRSGIKYSCRRHRRGQRMESFRRVRPEPLLHGDGSAAFHDVGEVFLSSERGDPPPPRQNYHSRPQRPGPQPRVQQGRRYTGHPPGVLSANRSTHDVGVADSVGGNVSWVRDDRHVGGPSGLRV